MIMLVGNKKDITDDNEEQRLINIINEGKYLKTMARTSLYRITYCLRK